MAKNIHIIKVILLGLTLSACQTYATKTPIPNDIVIIDEDMDSDNDGVPESRDQCPNTPINMIVDEMGCSIDIEVLSDPIPESRFSFAKNQYYPYSINGYQDKDYETQRKNMQQDFQRMREFFGRKPNEPICVKIEGYASKGKYGDTVKDIDLQRALTVKQLYKEWLGFDENNIRIEHYGSERPISNNDTSENTARNQRVYTRWIKCPIIK